MRATARATRGFTTPRTAASCSTARWISTPRSQSSTASCATMTASTPTRTSRCRRPSPGDATAYYEIGAEERTEKKALLARGWVYGTFEEPEKTIALNALAAALTGTNDAPLKKALLDAGLCEDLSFGTDDGMQQNYAYLLLYNADEKRADEAWRIAEDTLRNAGGRRARPRAAAQRAAPDRILHARKGLRAHAARRRLCHPEHGRLALRRRPRAGAALRCDV